MKRALGASEPPGLPMIKPQPSPSKEVPVPVQKKESPVPASQEHFPKPDEPSNELDSTATIKVTEFPAVSEPAAPSVAEKTVSPIVTKTEISPASQKLPSEMPKDQSVVPQPETQKDLKNTSSQSATPPVPPEKEKQSLQQPLQAITSFAKTPPSDQEAVKPLPKQPPKSGTPTAKSVPPSVQSAKQESGSFFGFGGSKTQPTVAKSGESVTGKMFGFGSSFLNSASTLISSAVQDEPKTTPPTPRKMSTTDKVTPKTTPPASPKPIPAKDTKLPSGQKTEEKKPLEKTPQDKIPSAKQVKMDKTPSELPKVPAEMERPSKSDESTCPLCKIKLNVGTKDPPNYNTCTECKNMVCNQCGFDSLPNMSEVNHCFCRSTFLF